MSIFRPVQVPCPLCAENVAFDVARSVNAGRRPELRAAILDGSFQREACPHCGTVFRVDPSLTYADDDRGQWLLVAPLRQLPEWGALEAQAQDTFAKSYGPTADPFAQAIGATLTPRLVFGWAALTEKLIAAAAGLDDITLELLKLSIIRSGNADLLSDDTELRLIAADDGTITLGQIKAAGEKLIERITLPRAAYQSIADARTAWAELRAALSGGPFVDLNRLLVLPGAAAA